MNPPGEGVPAVDGSPEKPPEGIAEQKSEGQKPAEVAEAEDEKLAQKSVDGLDAATRGDEDEIHSESPIDDDAPQIPKDFYYKAEDHISHARVMEDSGLPQDMLTLQYL